MFEDDLNQKLKTKHIRIHVVFVPVDRDQIIPSLLEGRGDIAMANLTITPERLKQVDFTEPTRRNVAEIVVTGPASAPIPTVREVSGQEVYVRPSSSFRESLEQLNAEFVKAGEAPVKLRLAPEDLEIEDILEMVNAGSVKAAIADDYVAEFWQQIFPKIVLNKDAAIRTGGDIAWMIRKDSPQLKAELNAFLARYPQVRHGEISCCKSTGRTPSTSKTRLPRKSRPNLSAWRPSFASTAASTIWIIC